MFALAVFWTLVAVLPQDPGVKPPTVPSDERLEPQSDTKPNADSDQKKAETKKINPEPASGKSVDKLKQTIRIDDTWKRLGTNQIWINDTSKQVMVRGQICLRQGPLEMFACPLQTKEHESVIAVEAKSSEVHACLVALGFEPGSPVQWQPDYKSATGPTVKIDVRWKQSDSEKTVDAKTMVKKSGTQQTLQTDWVFGGSEIFVDRVDGRKIYYADSGEMVCLSNFSTAMLDVPIQSSDSADGLLFEANTDAIPPMGTQVYLIMTPRK